MIELEEVLYETKLHGKAYFPYMVYKGKLPEYISSYPAHWHREMEIIYIVRGKGIVTVQTNQYVVDEGDIVIVAPEVIHSIKQFENYAMKYYNILFDFRLLENSSSHCYEKYLRGVYEHTQVLPTHLKKEDKLANSLKPYLQYLIENRKNKYSTDELMVKSSLYAIIHYLIQHSKESDNTSEKLEKNYLKIKNVLCFVQQHYDERITVNNAALLINYSASYFSKMFHELTGSSFTQYLKDYRLEIAADKLITTDKTITEISQETGFCNLPYFSRSFQHKFGVTPNEYRSRSK